MAEQTWIQFTDGQRLSKEWLDANVEKADTVLAKHKGTYPICQCRHDRTLPLYIAKKAHHYLAKMPGTGEKHSPDCLFYEPPVGWSGRQAYRKSAITVDENDMVHVKMVDGLGVTSAGQLSPPSAPTENKGKAPAKRGKLALKGLLHVLWEQAGFNRWYPAMRGKRNYYVMRHHALKAAQQIVVKGETLFDYLYIPETFRKDDVQAIADRTKKHLSHLLMNEHGRRQRMLVIGVVKAVRTTEYGVGITLKHAPAETRFWVNEEVWTSFQRKTGIDDLFGFIEDVPNPFAIMTVERTSKGNLAIKKLTIQATDENYLPYEGDVDRALLAHLVDAERRFIRQLQYDATREDLYPEVLLTDTGLDPIPMYLFGTDIDPKRDAALRAHVLSLEDETCWSWDHAVNPETMPVLPEPVAQSTRPAVNH